MNAEKNGPTAEWIARYEAEMAVEDENYMSVAPTPLFAWCCEQVIGGYAPDLVLVEMLMQSELWQRIVAMHDRLLRERGDR